MRKELVFKNKKAIFEFVFLEEFIAGIILKGTELKSILTNGLSFSDAYCYFKEGELYLKNLHIPEYKFASTNNQHEPKRDRKLLLTKKQLVKLREKSQEKGLTIIPSKIFTNENGLIKVAIELSRGKKLFDKRNIIKTKEIKRKIRVLV